MGGRQDRTKTLRRAWAALLAVLVVALQGLVPAAAMSATGGPAPFSICTAYGVRSAPGAADQHAGHKGFAGLACEQCVMASLAGLGAAPPDLRPSAIVTEWIAPALPDATVALPRIHPKPPSRAPPLPS